MCDIVADFTDRMALAHEMAAKYSTRMALCRYRARPEGLPDAVAEMLGLPDGEHYTIVPVDHAVWLLRKGRMTAQLAAAGATRRYVAAGTDKLSELLAQAVNQ